MPATKDLEKGQAETNTEQPRQEQRTNGNKGNKGNKQNGNEIPLRQTEQSREQLAKQEMTPTQGAERTRTGRVFLPAVDIYETPDAVVMVADMPGVDEKTVDVNLDKNILTVYGRVEEQYPAGHSLLYSEYRIGDYERSFTISNAIDWEKIVGTVKDGVLRLTLPKSGPAKTKKINITSA